VFSHSFIHTFYKAASNAAWLRSSHNLMRFIGHLASEAHLRAAVTMVLQA
jgi:hypothetical protein